MHRCVGPVSSHLVDNTIPSEPGVIDDDVDLTIAEIGCPFYKIIDVVFIEDIPDDSEGTTGFRRVDGVRDSVCFVYLAVRYIRLNSNKRLHTRINISDHHFGAFVCKESCCFCADALSCTSDDGYLACQEPSWVVQVFVHLV